MGAREVRLVEAPVAAAIGSGADMNKKRGMVSLCLGGGTTQAAVFSGGELLFSTSLRVGGQDLNDAIAAGIRKKYGVQVGHQTIEQIKTTLGSAYPMQQDETREVYGKDVRDGLPRAVFVSNWEIREMLLTPLERIVSAVKTVLERIPPELSEDVRRHGISLSGGAAMLRGINRLIQEITGVECSVSKRAAFTALAGAQAVLSDGKSYRRFMASPHTRVLTG